MFSSSFEIAQVIGMMNETTGVGIFVVDSYRYGGTGRCFVRDERSHLLEKYGWLLGCKSFKTEMIKCIKVMCSLWSKNTCFAFLDHNFALENT